MVYDSVEDARRLVYLQSRRSENGRFGSSISEGFAAQQWQAILAICTASFRVPVQIRIQRSRRTEEPRSTSLWHSCCSSSCCTRRILSEALVMARKEEDICSRRRRHHRPMDCVSATSVYGNETRLRAVYQPTRSELLAILAFRLRSELAYAVTGWQFECSSAPVSHVTYFSLDLKHALHLRTGPTRLKGRTA